MNPFFRLSLSKKFNLFYKNITIAIENCMAKSLYLFLLQKKIK